MITSAIFTLPSVELEIWSIVKGCLLDSLQINQDVKDSPLRSIQLQQLTKSESNYLIICPRLFSKNVRKSNKSNTTKKKFAATRNSN